MAWRFKPSKFKNTTPNLPKKEDSIYNLPIGTLSCTNNGIQSSTSHLAFMIEGEGGKLGTLPIGSKGSHTRNEINVVCAHSDAIDDFSFMNFNDDLLLTCSRDEKTKLWRLSTDGAAALEAELDLGTGRYLGSLCPHSTASGLVAYTSTSSATVVDWESQSVAFELDGLVEKGLSCSWSEDGRLLAANCDKGRIGLIWDVRAGPEPIQTLKLHTGLGREARVLFAGDKFISSGFTNKRVQEVQIFDTAKWGSPIHSQEFVATTGVLIPRYDADTKLVFLAGKGTNKLIMMELQDKQPVMSLVYEMALPEQLLGGCLSSKRSLNVMDGEVQTFYQLTKHSILPISCIVPRRSYKDFQPELFPDTKGGVAGCTADKWKSGSNDLPSKVSLNPSGPIRTSPTPSAPVTSTRTSSQIQIPPEPVQEAPTREGNTSEFVNGVHKSIELDSKSSETVVTIPVDSEIVVPKNEVKPVPVSEVKPMAQKVPGRELSPGVEVLCKVDSLERQVTYIAEDRHVIVDQLRDVVQEIGKDIVQKLSMKSSENFFSESTQSFSDGRLVGSATEESFKTCNANISALCAPKKDVYNLSFINRDISYDELREANTPNITTSHLSPIKERSTDSFAPYAITEEILIPRNSPDCHIISHDSDFDELADESSGDDSPYIEISSTKHKSVYGAPVRRASLSAIPNRIREEYGIPRVRRSVSHHELDNETDMKKHFNMHQDDWHLPYQKENIATEVSKKASPISDAPSVRIRPIGSVMEKRPMSTANRIRPKSCVVGQVASKYRHVETLAGIKANNAIFSNLRNVNTRLPPETNGVCASSRWIAVPLSGPAGVLSILDVDEPCKLADGVLDGFYNKAQVTDLQWCPFNDNELAVGTDIGVINFWTVSKEDGPRHEMEPSRTLKLGGEKIVCMRWHPLASDLMAIALSDCSVELWNVRTSTRIRRIEAHDTGILSVAWSADGKRLVTAGKDLMVRVFAPFLGSECLVAEIKCLESPRSARVLFVCDDRLILVVGLTKSSSRTVTLFDANTLRSVHTQMIDNAVQPLVPFYDFDSSVLFLTGKGDRTVQMFEISADSPYLLPLSHFTSPAGHQAIAFHNKTRCNVMAVEFQRAWRLTDKSLEQLIFRVPRVKKDVFQSDLFPEALVTWQASCTCDEWLSGVEVLPMFQSLRPDGVNALATDSSTSMPRHGRMSQAHVNGHDNHMEKNHEEHKPATIVELPVPVEKPVSEKPAPVKELVYPMDGVNEIKRVEKEVEASWSEKISKDTHLEQDHMEGVAEEEWIE